MKLPQEAAPNKPIAKGSLSEVIPELEDAIYEHIANCERKCGVCPEDIESNTVARKVLVHYAKKSFEPNKPAGASGKDKGRVIKHACRGLVEISKWSGVDGTQLMSMLPKKQRGTKKRASNTSAGTPQQTAQHRWCVENEDENKRIERFWQQHVIAPVNRAQAGSRALNTLYCEVLRGGWERVVKEARGYEAADDGMMKLVIELIFHQFCELHKPAIAAVRAKYEGVAKRFPEGRYVVPHIPGKEKYDELARHFQHFPGAAECGDAIAERPNPEEEQTIASELAALGY